MLTKKAPANRLFLLAGDWIQVRSGSSHAAAGVLAQVRADVFHLGGVLRHRLLGGFQHIIAVIRDRLADGAGLGLGSGDDLGRTLLGGADDLGLAHEDGGRALLPS